jgi:parvulin-like peptidyl-prolyl isomerase
LSPELAKAALAAQPGRIVGPVAVAQGAVLFQVTERKGVDPAEFAKAREQTRATLRQEKLGRLLASLVEKRRRELGVEYDPETLQRFGMAGAA